MNSLFSQPAAFFSNADPKTVGALVANASDIALIVGRDGIIKDVAGDGESLAQIGAAAWRGSPLHEVVSDDSRQHVDDLIRLAPGDDLPAMADIRHPVPGGEQVLVRYSAIATDADGDVVLLGRNLSPLRSLQERLLLSQQTMERTFERQRQDEARYRMVFQVASEAVLIVDVSSGLIREANRAALQLLKEDGRNVLGRRLGTFFDREDRSDLQSLLTGVLGTDTASEGTARLADGRRVRVKANLFQSRDASTYLVHLQAAVEANTGPIADHSLARLIHLASESIVLTDDAGAVLWANDSFLDLSQCGKLESAVGRSLGDFFDGTAFNIGVTLDNVRGHGRLKMLPTTLRSLSGQTSEVELSVVAMPDGGGFGVVIRSVALRAQPIELSAVPKASERNAVMARTGEPVEDLIGKVPLKDLVRDEMDAIEKSCIASALQLTGNNRALTAKVLGLSRQGLYSKLRRYGFASDED
ncbi:transcriptional regulator PpsR [Rhodobium orientis]|uniref:Transcriptional regulator PpsR n=1 Tax=Rhodobium orientis TaxID=34017 RepID=A0A327JIQ9_9HYPH|nr:transcriptional regulator PpsR [Rhodobium orientis]MBB4303337.1 transcriptional regulator PpsR [Rhodobium orientis]MBK5951568.1 transcriptional regulator PpsR [Rhodobium orientis]RAI24712.1 transcriptional regulator PpsR [Rhodobium orientis]